MPKSNEMVTSSICFRIPLSHTHTWTVTFQLLHCPSFILLYSLEQKKELHLMNFPATCLHCPPTVWLSASFTLAIFSHFANLPTRWQGAGKLLKVLWLQMSEPDVLLFLKRSFDFIYYLFPAFCTSQRNWWKKNVQRPN